jgi:hypothetical protein
MGANTLMHDSVIINCHATQNKREDHTKLAKINKCIRYYHCHLHAMVRSHKQLLLFHDDL